MIGGPDVFSRPVVMQSFCFKDTLMFSDAVVCVGNNEDVWSFHDIDIENEVNSASFSERNM